MAPIVQGYLSHSIHDRPYIHFPLSLPLSLSSFLSYLCVLCDSLLFIFIFMEIPTPRLLLREFTEEDWRSLLAFQNDPRYLTYYDADTQTESDARKMLGWFLDYRKAEPRLKFQLAITLRDSGRLIGSCGVRTTDIELREADMGGELDPNEWGKGYATEAFRPMLEFAFREMKVHRLWTSSIAENRAAGKLVERLGFTREATLREKSFLKGRWWDVAIHAMLDREWELLQQVSPFFTSFRADQHIQPE